MPASASTSGARFPRNGARAWDLDAHLPVDSFAAVLTFADKSVHAYLQHGRSYNALLTKYH